MVNKVWVEISVQTDEQSAVITHNEERDGVVLTLKEISEPEKRFGMHFTYDEALELSRQLENFVQDQKDKEG